MAYVPKQLPDDQENQFARTDPTTPYPAPVGGGSSGSGTAPGAGTSTQFGSNAAKLTDYLKANEPQIQEFGQEVAGKLNETYNQAKSAVDEGFGSFNQSIQGGYTPNDPTLVNQAIQNPSGFTSTPGNVQKFQSLYNNQYTGPQSAEGSEMYANVNNQVNKAVQDAALVGSEGGMNTYLDQFGGTNKTQGMKTLDTALLQRSPTARNAIQSAAQPFQGLTDYLSGKVTDSNKAIANAKTEASTSRDATRAAAGQASSSFNTGLQNQLTAAMQARDAYNQNVIPVQGAVKDVAQLYPDAYTRAYNAIAGSTVIDPRFPARNDLFNYIGSKNSVSRDQLQPFLDLPLSVNAPELAGVAGADDYATSAAWEQLLGENYNEPLDQSMISRAGSYQAPPSIPGGGQDLAKQYSSQQRLLNDMAMMYGNNRGPIDPMKIGSDPVAVANKMIPYMNQFGLAYYGMDPNVADAIRRIAANQY